MISCESLFISWHRMLLGVDIPDVQQIVMLRPPNMEHSVVQVSSHPQYWTLFKPVQQAMGRAGRLTASGARTRTLLYVLFNSQDLGSNVKGMTDGMRQLCLSSDTCLRALLKRKFVGEYDAGNVAIPGFCCSVCEDMGD